jgi:hypothetical protein
MKRLIPRMIRSIFPFIIGSTQRKSAIGAFENIKSYIPKSLKILNKSNKQINISSLYDTTFVEIFFIYDLHSFTSPFGVTIFRGGSLKLVFFFFFWKTQDAHKYICALTLINTHPKPMSTSEELSRQMLMLMKSPQVRHVVDGPLIE